MRYTRVSGKLTKDMVKDERNGEMALNLMEDSIWTLEFRDDLHFSNRIFFTMKVASKMRDFMAKQLLVFLKQQHSVVYLTKETYQTQESYLILRQEMSISGRQITSSRKELDK